MTLAEVFISWQSNIPTTIQTLAAIIKPAIVTPEEIKNQGNEAIKEFIKTEYAKNIMNY